MKDFIRRVLGAIFIPFYIYLSGISSALIYFNSKINKNLTNKISIFWTINTFILIKLLFVKNIRLYYDPEILKDKKSLLISNHVNNLDCIVIWMSLLTLKKKDIIFNAKNTVIIYGNMFQVLSDDNINFVFLKRDLNYDYITLTDSCKNMKKQEQYVSVLFPEGTLNTKKSSSKENISRSTHRNIEPFKNVIVPKTKGFKIILENLSEDLDSIIDCTIIYRKNPTLYSFLKGKRTCVDVYLNKRETPKENYEKWLMEMFRSKDKILEEKIDKKPYFMINITIPQRYKNLMLFALPWLFKKFKRSFNKKKSFF